MAMQFLTNRDNMVPPNGVEVDFIDWERFPDRVKFNRNSAFLKTCNLGHLNFDILSPQNWERRTQGDTWDGAFDSAAGESVLCTSSAPITILFDKAIRGAGANIDIKKGVLFRATIKAFQGNNQISIPTGGSRGDGKSNHDGLGTAIFVGFLENDPTHRLGIDAIEFHIALLDQNASLNTGFAINLLELVLE